MLVKNISMTLVKVSKKSGVSKTTGQPYSFHNARLVDEDFNVFNLLLSKEVEADEEKLAELLEASNKQVQVDINIYPVKFNLNGSVVDIFGL